MDQCTQEVRMQNWKNIINQCLARPEGQTAKQWMDEHHICEQTYYLWQRRVRQEAYDQIQPIQKSLPVISSKEEISFAEIPMSKQDVQISRAVEQACAPVAVIRTETFSIELSSDIPDWIVTSILKEIAHA
ncbi:MAG: IS66 family insertion sequence element accessory protein TnpB [Mobilitalea sp.]